MTVIAEEMEVTGILNCSRCEGLKESFLKWAPGCRPIEQCSGSVGVQRMSVCPGSGRPGDLKNTLE